MIAEFTSRLRAVITLIGCCLLSPGLSAQIPQQKETLYFSVFHRRDASKFKEWTVNHGDTLFYQAYYPKNSEYYRFLVYRFKYSHKEGFDVRILSLAGTDTLDLTEVNHRQLQRSWVLNKDIRGVTEQRISIAGGKPFNFTLLFAEKKIIDQKAMYLLRESYTYRCPDCRHY